MELWLLCQQVSNNLHEVKIMRRYCIQKREDYTLYNKLSREIRYLFWLHKSITNWQCLFAWPGSITLLPFQGNCEKNQGPWPSLPSQVSVTFNPWKKRFSLSHVLIIYTPSFRVDMSAAFLEKLWNIGIIPTKWSLENCDKVCHLVKSTNTRQF